MEHQRVAAAAFLDNVESNTLRHALQGSCNALWQKHMYYFRIRIEDNALTWMDCQGICWAFANQAAESGMVQRLEDSRMIC